MICAIVAVDNDWGIGYKGNLLEAIPADLKWFKSHTLGKTVVMGKNTWYSLPKRPLPKRQNVVLTDTAIYDEVLPDLQFSNLDILKDWMKNQPEDKIMYITGGGMVYRELLPICDMVLVTKIYKDHENIDTYFPNLDEMDEWVASPLEDIMEYDGIKYQFWQYDRVN